MDTKIKNSLIGLGVFFLALILIKVVYGVLSIGAAIVAFLFGALVTVVLIARSRGEKPKDVAEEVVTQIVKPSSDAIKLRMEEQLLKTNEQLRLQFASTSVINSSELVIDLLLEVVPRAMNESPGSTATFDLQKISTNYFPELISDYLDLSGEHRLQQEEQIVEQINKLFNAVQEAEASLNEGKLDEYNVSSSFLNAKLS